VATGRLITIEGVDGAGKSTLGLALVESLGGRGLSVELLHEPGGVGLAERIARLVKDPGQTIGGRAEALLYAAARAELVEKRVRPLLAGGTWVVLDRFADSSLAYQGAARGLGVEEVRRINLFGTGGLAPDRTLLLRVRAGTSTARLSGRGWQADRIEREGGRFFEAVALAYEELAEREPVRMRVLDAEQPPARVLELALGEIADLLAG
jgi:dTMP kinase